MRVWPPLNRRCPDTTWRARVVRSQSELPTPDELVLKCEPSEVRGCSDRSGSMSAGVPAIPAPGPFPGSHAPPIGQLRVARRPNRPPGGPLRAFQPQGHTLSTPLKPPSTPFPSATGSARSTAPALPACSARLFRSRRLDQQSKAHAIRHHVAAPRSLPLPAAEPSVEFKAARTGAAA